MNHYHMENKKLFKSLVLGLILGFLVFATIVTILFRLVQNNPQDQVAMTYLRHEESFLEEYGEPITIGRNLIEPKEKTKNGEVLPYTVETSKLRLLVYVTLERNEKNWHAVAFDLREVEDLCT